MQKLLAFIIILTLCMPFECHAADDKQLIIGVENHTYYPHYQFVDGQYGGFARDLLDAFAKDYDYQANYIPYSVTELFQAFKKKQVMLKYPDNPIWSFEERSGLHIAYSNPVVDYIDGIMTDSNFPIQKLEELKTLGTIQGFTPFPLLSLVRQNQIEILYFKDLNELIIALLNKKINAIYVNIDVCNYYIKNTLKKPNLLEFVPTLPHTTGSYYLSSSSRPDLIKQFNDFLYQRRDFIAGLKSKYQITPTASLLK